MPRTRSQTQLPEGPTHALQEKLSFILDIETTNTAPCMGMLVNRFEEEDSELKALHAGTLRRWDNDAGEHFDLTPEELAEPGFVGKTLTLEAVWKDSESGEIVGETRKTYKNERGFFTVKEVVEAVEDFERLDRPKTKWFGGINCHHIFWQGLFPNKKRDAVSISWGS